MWTPSISGAKGENGDAALQRRDVRNTSGGRRQPETKGLIRARGGRQPETKVLIRARGGRQPETKGLIRAGVVTSRKLKG